MNLYLFWAVSVNVALLSACVFWVWQEIPILALCGLVVSSFTYGFLLGEQGVQD
jgi:hypothetical protein